MANVHEEARIPVYLNDEEAKSALKNLQKEADKWRQIMKEAMVGGDMKGMKEAERELKKVNKQASKLKQAAFDTNKVLDNLSSASANDLRRTLRQLNIEQQKLNRGTKEYAAYTTKIKKVRSELNRVNLELKEQRGLISKSADFINRYWGIIGGAFASLAGIQMTAQRAIDASLDREDMRGKVKALTGLVDEELAWLEQRAIEFSTTQDETGVRIQKSVDEIMEAYQLVGSAKPALLKNKEALAEVTRQVLILSEAAEGMSLPDAIDATTKALNQYNAPAEQSARFTNSLAGGAKLGAVQIPDVGLSIKEFGKNAADANVPIEKSVSLIEVLGEKGGKVGARAGIQLRNFFTILSSGAAETNPEIVGLDQALENLEKKQLTSAEYTKIFGRENANTAKVIVEYRDYINSMTEAIKAENYVVQQAIDNTTDKKAALQQARNEAHEYAVEIGDKLVPAQTYFVRTGKLMLKLISAVIDLLKNHGKKVLIVVGTITAYRIAVMLAARWDSIHYGYLVAKNGATKAAALLTGVLTGKVKLATVAQKAWNLAQKASPIGLLAGLLAGAGIALVAYIKKTKGAKDQQAEFNDELQKTEDHLGKKQYDQFLEEIGLFKEKMITLADGSVKFIKVYNDNINVLDEFGKKVKSLRETELENFKQFFTEEIVNMQRSLETLDPDSVLYKVQESKIAEYSEALGLVNTELRRYAELTDNLDGSDVPQDFDSLKKALERSFQEEKNILDQKLLDEKTTKELHNLDMEALELAHLISMKELHERFGEDTVSIEADIIAKRLAIKKRIDDADENTYAEIEAEMDAHLAKYEKQLNAEADAVIETEKKKQEEIKKTAEEREKAYEAQIEFAVRSGAQAVENAESFEEAGRAILNSIRDQIKAEMAMFIAAAIRKAMVGVPFPFNIAAAAAAGGTATYLFNKLIPEFYAGGHTGTGGKYEPAGIVHKKEYVIPQEGVENPQVRQFIDIFEYARQRGQLARLDLRPILKVISPEKSLATGGFSSQQTTVSQPYTIQTIDLDRFEKFIERLEKLKWKIDVETIRRKLNELENIDKQSKM